MKKTTLILITLLLITACAKQQSTLVNLKTEDGINLIANYSLSYDKQKEAVILLHELNKDKEAYNPLISTLNQNNYTTLALDFRGHGQSEGNKEDYLNYIKDIKTAKEFLKDKGYKKIHIVGASIGANAALNYATTDKEIKKLILLSPKEDYNGLKTDIANNYIGELYIITAGENTNFGETLKNFFKGEKKHRPSPSIKAQGTELLTTTDAISKTLYFLRR